MNFHSKANESMRKMLKTWKIEKSYRWLSWEFDFTESFGLTKGRRKKRKKPCVRLSRGCFLCEAVAFRGCLFKKWPLRRLKINLFSNFFFSTKAWEAWYEKAEAQFSLGSLLQPLSALCSLDKVEICLD